MHDGGEEYNDEVGMVKNNLRTLMRACKGMHELMQNDENMPEWVQEKIATSKGMMVAVWDYMLSQHAEGEIYFNESKKQPKKKKPVKESHQPLAKSLMKDFQSFKKNN